MVIIITTHAPTQQTPPHPRNMHIHNVRHMTDQPGSCCANGHLTEYTPPEGQSCALAHGVICETPARQGKPRPTKSKITSPPSPGSDTSLCRSDLPCLWKAGRLITGRLAEVTVLCICSVLTLEKAHPHASLPPQSQLQHLLLGLCHPSIRACRPACQ